MYRFNYISVNDFFLPFYYVLNIIYTSVIKLNLYTIFDTYINH